MEASGLEENKIPARKGGRVARNARLELEQKTGKKIVSADNFKTLQNRKVVTEVRKMVKRVKKLRNK